MNTTSNESPSKKKKFQNSISTSFFPISQLNDSAKFNISLLEHFSRLQRLEERANLLEDSKLLEYYKMAQSELNAIIGHLEGGKKWMVGLDQNLDEIEGKLGKFGREKGG